MSTDNAQAFDLRTLITAANACYVRARDKALPPPVRAKLLLAADALVAAVDAHHEATATPAPKVGGYDKDRCRSCGREWPIHVIECANDLHRPIERPAWLDKAYTAAIGPLARERRDERAGSGAMDGRLKDNG